MDAQCISNTTRVCLKAKEKHFFLLPTARCSLWGWMLLRRATARVWEGPSLIHTASARDAAGFRQSVTMPVIVRLWVVSDTLAGGALMRGMVSSWRVWALRLASCRCWASCVGVCTRVCLGFLLR